MTWKLGVGRRGMCGSSNFADLSGEGEDAKQREKRVSFHAARSLTMAHISEMWQTTVTWPQSLFSVVSDLLICETWDFLAIVKEQNRWSLREWVADSEAEERKDCTIAGSISFCISGLSSPHRE